MKLPMVPPTNPPAYVGPLRTSSSSVKSTVETMNCTGCGQTGNGLAGPPTRAAGRGRISADLSVGIDCEGVCGWRLPRPRRPVSGAVREPQATAPETADWRSARSPSPPAAPHDRFGDGAATSRRRDHCARPHSPEREPAAGRLATRSGGGDGAARTARTIAFVFSPQQIRLALGRPKRRPAEQARELFADTALLQLVRSKSLARDEQLILGGCLARQMGKCEFESAMVRFDCPSRRRTGSSSATTPTWSRGRC